MTDFFDGYIAKKINAGSALGKALDPIADKILVLTLFFFLTSKGRITGHAVWGCVLILMREIMVLGLRSTFGFRSLSSPLVAKLKTTFQLVALAFFLWPSVWSISYGNSTLWISVILSWWSGGNYLFQSLPFLKKRL